MPKAFLVRKRPVPHTTWKGEGEEEDVERKKEKLTVEESRPRDEETEEERMARERNTENVHRPHQTESSYTHPPPWRPHCLDAPNNQDDRIDTTEARQEAVANETEESSRQSPSSRATRTQLHSAQKDDPVSCHPSGKENTQQPPRVNNLPTSRTAQPPDSLPIRFDTGTSTSSTQSSSFQTSVSLSAEIATSVKPPSATSRIRKSSVQSDTEACTEASHEVTTPSRYSPLLGSFPGPSLSHPHTTSSHFPFSHSPFPLSPREQFFPSTPPHTNPHVFSFPPSIVRPIPTNALSWPIQPVPLRLPLGLRPNFGVISPEEVPSPPGSTVADMPTSPLLCVGSPGLDPIRGLTESGLGVDFNNNGSNNNCGVAGIGCSEDILKGRQRNQSFKDFLETAKVRVETINDGNGLKNPLLSPDKARLPLDTGPLGFMTLDAFPSCPVCGVKCDTPRLLQRHVRSHKEIKRYLCAWCGKGFNDTFDLKRHTRTHTGVRPYKCESCGKAFTQRCSLESHCRKIHGQILPFTFNERRTKLYVCEECGHSTPGIDLHFNHLRAHHPGHPALGRPHHDRRQFKFCMKESEGEERDGEEDVAVEEEMGSKESEQCKTVSFGCCPEEGEQLR